MFLAFLGLELTSRVFWRVAHGIPLFHTERFVQLLYPQLKRIHFEAPPEAAPEATPDEAPGVPRARSGGESLDVLILGASVLHEEFGPFEEILERRLREQTRRPLNLYNLSTPGHTSRDSLLKYDYAIEHRPVDLVIVYHGINELRANNCPPQVFRDDYSHYAFNRLANAYFEHPGLSYSSFIASAYYVWSRLAWKLGLFESIPRGRPNEEWLEYGGDIRTAACLRNNLELIVDDATARGIPVLLMSYAHYIAEGYTFEKFLGQELDYGTFRLPIELWGSVENVHKGLVTHNGTIADVAKRKDCLFVDQNAEIERNSANFNDVCHLSDAGLEIFVGNLIAAIEHLL